METVFILIASSWLPPSSMPLPSLEDPGPAVASAPACATTDSGAFLLIWEEKRGEERRVLVRRREAGPHGEWGAPSRVDTGAAPQAIEPRIALAGNHAYLVWQEVAPGSTGEAYFRRSTDEGRTWADPMRVPIGGDPAAGEPAALPSMLSVAANPGGVVLAAWEDRRSGARDIFTRRSLDFGASWEPFETRLDSDGARGPAASYHPQVILQESAAVVWWDEAAGLSDVHVRTSPDRGRTWKDIVRLDPGSAGETASRDVGVASRREVLAIAWEDEAGGLEREIIARLSSDAGQTWSAESRLGRPRWAGAIEDPRVAIDAEGRAHVIWIALPAEEKPEPGAAILKKPRHRPEAAPALFHAAIDFNGRVLDPNAVPAAAPRSALAWIGGAEGVLWMAWVGTRIDAGSIEAAYSIDAGKTWRTTGLSRAQNPEALFVPVLSLVGSVDASGSLHLAWVEGRAERERLRFVRLEPPVESGK